MYGCGEGALHPLFKAGWKGEQPVLPILEGGKTVLPMIHVRDLAAIVVRISEKKPEQKEYLAVDDGRCKQADIVKAVAQSLQDGSVTDMNTLQYLAWMSENDATTEGHLLPLQLSLKVRFSAKDALDIPWTSLSGFVANIAKVTEEFRVYRAITAMKVVFMGPPASGKSFYAALMSQEYAPTTFPQYVFVTLWPGTKCNTSSSGRSSKKWRRCRTSWVPVCAQPSQ